MLWIFDCPPLTENHCRNYMWPFVPVYPPRQRSSQRQTEPGNTRTGHLEESQLMSDCYLCLSLSFCLLASHHLNVPPLLSPSHAAQKQLHASFQDSGWVTADAARDILSSDLSLCPFFFLFCLFFFSVFSFLPVCVWEIQLSALQLQCDGQ